MHPKELQKLLATLEETPEEDLISRLTPVSYTHLDVYKRQGKYNGYLLEGMACPGGCIAGAGTIQPIKKTAASLEQMKKQAPFEESMDTVYDAMLPILEKL